MNAAALSAGRIERDVRIAEHDTESRLKARAIGWRDQA
jgi:hypothetical protein